MTERAYRPEQVADRWSVSRRHVYSLVQSGALGHIRIGTIIRIRQADIDAYEARQWHAPVSSNPDTASSSGTVVSMSAGGRTAGTAFQHGRRIAAKLRDSSPSL
jgi:excisionase family DNA binding protein